MEKFTEIFKKFKTVDIIIVAGVILALILGFLTYKNFRQTAAKQIEATSKISFQVTKLLSVSEMFLIQILIL